MIKNRPCKVIEVSSSKTGKHGHAKCHFVALDIFTGKKVEDLVPASHTTYAPNVVKTEYQCMDVSEDGFVSVMDAEGNCREDLKLPREMKDPKPPNAEELSKRVEDLMKAQDAGGPDFFVIVQHACATE